MRALREKMESLLGEGKSREQLKQKAIEAGSAAMWKAMATTAPKGSAFKSLVHTLDMKLGKDLDDFMDGLAGDDALQEQALNRFAENLLLNEATPSLVKHCVRAVSDRYNGDTHRAFAICVASMQKAGYIEKGSMNLTAAGKAKSSTHAQETDAGKKAKAFEKMIKAASPHKESVEPECLSCEAKDAPCPECKESGGLVYEDACDCWTCEVCGWEGSNAPVAEGKQTYAQAQADIVAGLQKEGWTIKSGLKIPQALSPDGSYKLFFKAQAIYLGKGDSDLGGARSLHLGDIRGSTYEKFKAALAQWTKEEAVEANVSKRDMSEMRRLTGIDKYPDRKMEATKSKLMDRREREAAGVAGAHGDWRLAEESDEMESAVVAALKKLDLKNFEVIYFGPLKGYAHSRSESPPEADEFSTDVSFDVFQPEVTEEDGVNVITVTIEEGSGRFLDKAAPALKPFKQSHRSAEEEAINELVWGDVKDRILTGLKRALPSMTVDLADTDGDTRRYTFRFDVEPK